MQSLTLRLPLYQWEAKQASPGYFLGGGTYGLYKCRTAYVCCKALCKSQALLWAWYTFKINHQQPHTPGISVFRGWRLEHREIKASLHYRKSLRPAWAQRPSLRTQPNQINNKNINERLRVIWISFSVLSMKLNVTD